MSRASLRLIVGLGNPEKKYAKTRHNFGFLVGQSFAHSRKWVWKQNSAVNGMMAQGVVEDKDVVILLPLTYVNHSGLAVKEIVSRKNIALENILVVCDDLNLSFGQLRFRPEGSDGGHNGLTSIIAELRTKEFPRLRLGIGRPQHKEDVVDFVLEEFSVPEQKKLPEIVSQAAECCLTWLSQGTKDTMNLYNKRTLDE